MDCLVSPLQDRLDEWKKTTLLLDKDHAKEFKRLKQELKKRHAYEAMSSKKGKRMSGSSFASGSTLSGIFSKSMESMEGSDKLLLLEEMERKALRRVLIEERSRFCLFVNFLRPVVDEEIAMLNEVNHLQEIMDHLSNLTVDPYILPSSSEMVIADLKLAGSRPTTTENHYSNPQSFGNHHEMRSSTSTLSFKSQSQLNLRTEDLPASPVSSFSASSRKSSMCSISSFNDSDRGSEESHSPVPPAGVRRHGTTGHHHQRQHRKTNSLSSHSMFDSRNIESLITYHPSNASSNVSQQHQSRQQLQQQQSLPYRDMSLNRYAMSGNPVDIPVVPGTLRRSSGMASSTTEIPSSGDYACLTSSNIMTQSCRDSIIYCSSGNIPLSGSTLSRSGSRTDGRPPPLPPARRTSSISDPHAITLGTLASTGCSTYEEVRTLRKTGDSTSNIYASFQVSRNCDQQQPLYQPLTQQQQPIYSNYSDPSSSITNTTMSAGPLVPERSSSCSGGRSSSQITNHTGSSTSTPTATSRDVVSSSTTQSGHNSCSNSSTAVSSPAKTPTYPGFVGPTTTSANAANNDYMEASGMIGNAISTLKAVYAQTTGSNSGSLRNSQHNSFDSPSDTAPLLASSTASPTTSISSGHTIQTVHQQSPSHLTSNILCHQLSREDSLPPPPPEAFMPPAVDHFDSSNISGATISHGLEDCTSSSGASLISTSTIKPTTERPTGSSSTTTTGQRTYNRLTNVHRDFLQTLNDTLSQNRGTQLSPRLTKRRSMSVGEHDWDSDRDSGIVPNSASLASSSGSSSINSSNSAQTLSLQQSLMRLMGHHPSPSSFERQNSQGSPPAGLSSPSSTSSLCSRLAQRLTQTASSTVTTTGSGSPGIYRKSSMPGMGLIAAATGGHPMSHHGNVGGANHLVHSNSLQCPNQSSESSCQAPGSRSGSWPSSEAEQQHTPNAGVN